MADYGCFPLWEASPGEVGNIDPDSLPISTPLKVDLGRWAASYEKTLKPDDPVSSGFVSDQEEERFKQEGRSLQWRLQEELGSSYLVKIKI
jgi:hypothetical protein